MARGASAGVCLTRLVAGTVLACALLVLAVPPACAADEDVCAAAIAAVQARTKLPPRLLATLALVESGRLVGRRVVPWPWSINVEGAGRFFDSKAEAVVAVQALQAAGVQSIDVGCMQVNLRMHPRAFATLDDAFDPDTNTRYGADFLRALYAASGSWATAMTAYHSTTPGLAADYARRILAIWPGAAVYGLTAPDPALDAAAALAGLAGARHDYTAEFAAQVAADMSLRRGRSAGVGAQPVRSQLRRASVVPQHGPAWPRVP